MEEETKRGLNLDRQKLIAIAAVTLALALMVAVLILFSPRKTAPIDHFYKSLQKGSAAELQKCMPQAAWDHAAETYDGEQSINAYLSGFTAAFCDELTSYYGAKLKISYRVTNKRDYDNQQLHQLALLLQDMYGLDPVTITEGCEITVDTTCKGSLKKETTSGDLFIVYRLNGKWYLLYDPLSDA